MRQLRLFIPVSCRSDDPLTKTMIDAFEKEKWCDVITYSLVPACLGNNIQYVTNFLTNQVLDEFYPDLALICGDRIEMLACALAIFHVGMWNKSKVAIAHYGSGITNTIATFDDINRHSIALMAEICLCEGVESAMRVSELWGIIGKKIPRGEMRIDIVGNLYLDTIDDIDESLVPSEPYDLILINKKTIGEPEYFGLEFMKERLQVYIGSNPDGMAIHESLITYESVPRPQFLGLLKHCQRFITNSSSAFYEAPFFLKPEQIIQVGERNKNRSTPREWNQDYKTSEKIVQIIKKWWEDKNE